MLEQDLIAILRMRPWWVHPKFFFHSAYSPAFAKKQEKGVFTEYVEFSQIHKKLYKETIWSKTSWKGGNGQLGKFYFPVGKIFFLSWKIIFFQLGTFRSPFLRIFARFWLLMVIISEYQKCFTFSFSFRQKKDFERWAVSNERVGTLRAASEDFSLTQISPIPQILLLFREIREICLWHNSNKTLRTQHADVPTKLIALQGINLSKNKKKEFARNAAKYTNTHLTNIQHDTITLKPHLKHTKKRLKCFSSFT